MCILDIMICHSPYHPVKPYFIQQNHVSYGIMTYHTDHLYIMMDTSYIMISFQKIQITYHTRKSRFIRTHVYHDYFILYHDINHERVILHTGSVRTR